MQSREGSSGHAQFRCRAAGSDRLQRALPKRLFLLLCKPLLRTTLFVCGFYWVQDRTVPGYRYDARACVVANQGGVIELMYFLWQFPGTPVLDMGALSAFLLPAAAALGVLDSATVEQLADDSVPTPGGRERRQTSALAQYQCMMATHNETHAGIHFGLTRLCLFLAGDADGDELQQADRMDDDELLDGAFSCGLPLQPIWVKRGAKEGAISGARTTLTMLTSLTNKMEVLLLPVFAPSEEEQHYPELFRRNVLSVLRDGADRLRGGRARENPFGGGAGPRKVAMEESWRVEDDEDDEDDEDSDWSEGSEEDLERGSSNRERRSKDKRSPEKRGKKRTPRELGGGRERKKDSGKSQGERDRDRVQREREKLNRKRQRERERFASPSRASMPNLGSMEDDLSDLSEEEIPATHWGARVLREDAKMGAGAKRTKSKPKRQQSGESASTSDGEGEASDDGVMGAKGRSAGYGDAGDIHRGGKRKPKPPRDKREKSGGRGGCGSKAGGKKKDDGVRAAKPPDVELTGGGQSGWLRLHKAGDYAGVVRWCVDCELSDDTLLVGMPLTDYEMGIVAPTFCEMLGLTEAEVTRQHENGMSADLEESLQKAFRNLSRGLHPDKQQGRDGAKATADFQLLKLAKETLGVEKDRGRYLKKLGAFRRTAVRVPWSFSGAMAGGSRRQ